MACILTRLKDVEWAAEFSENEHLPDYRDCDSDSRVDNSVDNSSLQTCACIHARCRRRCGIKPSDKWSRCRAFWSKGWAGSDLYRRYDKGWKVRVARYSARRRLPARCLRRRKLSSRCIWPAHAE